MSRHVPVLLKKTIDALNLTSGKNIVDCTLGDAGHSEAILEKTAPNGKLLGIDADAEAVLRAKRFLYRFEDRTILVRENFINLSKILAENNFQTDAILMDLGWSSPQFEERGRGFSFMKDEPLDMRYEAGQNRALTAAEILNSYPQKDLEKIFHFYGEEKFSAEIAKAIMTERENKKIARTTDLVEIILRVYREQLHTDKEIPRIGDIHPATKIFQALRIEVNQELEVLKKVLPDAIAALQPGGRLAIITFHSLEDRIVKQFFKKIENKEIKLVNKKPIIAGAEELKENPRARSAKLRVAEKNTSPYPTEFTQHYDTWRE